MIMQIFFLCSTSIRGHFNGGNVVQALFISTAVCQWLLLLSQDNSYHHNQCILTVEAPEYEASQQVTLQRPIRNLSPPHGKLRFIPCHVAFDSDSFRRHSIYHRTLPICPMETKSCVRTFPCAQILPIELLRRISPCKRC